MEQERNKNEDWSFEFVFIECLLNKDPSNQDSLREITTKTT